jgi:NAD(P)-dependent dehydrogenase (short-subunit alcohol dehydrogenase family)
MRLNDKIALITSATHPCAGAIAAGFAREGADCAIVDGQLTKAEQLAAEIRALGRRALALEVDVTKKAQVEDGVRRTVAEFGRIDILLNCSAVSHDSDFLGLAEEAFNDSIARGPKAYFLFAQAVGRHMAEQRSGKIINLATMDAHIGSGESTANSAAYSSIDSMTRAIAQALGFYGVNANALLAGPMNNFSGSAEEVGERMRRIPLGRLGKPDDLVGAAMFLASDDSNFVSGASICVDAGYANAAVTEDGFRPPWGKVWAPFEIPPTNK